MIKPSSILFLTLICAAVACGSSATPPSDAQHSTTEPASAFQATQAPGQDPSPFESPAAAFGTPTLQAVTTPSGLRVVYLRDGNLWSWTESGGSVQLTSTGDMSTARLSDDGQILAYMRGREVWTVRMDGTDARLLATQAEAGGALWFAPSGSLLAVSTKNHIDVIDLSDSSLKTVVTYPDVPEGYFPEIVWLPDALGFKTVIPPTSDSGKAEFLFVFIDGTVASLAKFGMLPLYESLPFLSPDGNYLIFAAKTGDDSEALFLMDSSGATRPYGEPAASVRAYGWLPDSKRFAYGWDEPQHNFIGSVNGPPAYNETIFPPLVRWVKNEQYLALDSGNLILGDLSGAKLMIDSAVTDFDVVH